MKIFFPVQVFFPSQAGGPANTVYWLAKNLRSRGFKPTIIATDQGIGPETPLNKWIVKDAGSVIYVQTRFSYFPLRQTFLSLRTFFRSDVVHLSSFFFPTAFVTGLAARVLGKKIAWSARGELDNYSLSYSKFRKLPLLWLLRKVIGTYPVFHSTSDEETEFIKLRFGDAARVFQITNYIEIAPKVERKPGDYLLFIGRLHRKKAIDNLIRSLTMSQTFMRSGFVLKIAGEGTPSYTSMLKQLVDELGLTERVEFLGHVEGVDKLSLYADAHFTIMPSHSENFGNVVLESLAQETPVVASIHTPWDALKREKVGFWVDNSPEGLASTFDKILSMDNKEYEDYRSRCRDFVLTNFDIEQNFDKWLEFYSSFEESSGN